MLRPIPARILRSVAQVSVCIGVDAYNNQQYATYTVQHVHLQPANTIRKSPSNTDCVLRAILFVDRRHSTPAIAWDALFTSAHEKGGDMRVTVRGVTYTAESVEPLYDDTDQLHHWEIGLV